MKIRAQIAMVLNLDKCIGCTCSVTCKNVWTSRPGMEYAWFNNVETKPGIGYPKEWENQKRWNGGWIRRKNGKLEPKIGGKFRVSPLDEQFGCLISLGSMNRGIYVFGILEQNLGGFDLLGGV